MKSLEEETFEMKIKEGGRRGPEEVKRAQPASPKLRQSTHTCCGPDRGITLISLWLEHERHESSLDHVRKLVDGVVLCCCCVVVLIHEINK